MIVANVREIFYMKSPKLLFAVAIACALASCSKNDVEQPQQDQQPVATETAVTAGDSSDMYTPPALYHQKSITTNVDVNIGGYIQYLPYNYTSTTKNYPLIISIHGVGELGDGTPGKILKVARNGVPRVINDGKFPNTFTTSAGTFSFIVLSPQFRNWPSATNVNDMIDYAIKHYRVDVTRIYVTGLSMGGGACMEYGAAFGKRIAALVPMANCNGASTTKALSIAKSGLAVKAFHNRYDPRCSYLNTYNYVNYINSDAPIKPAYKTIFLDKKGHNCWAEASDPAYKESGQNVYQWMLNYHR